MMMCLSEDEFICMYTTVIQFLIVIFVLMLWFFKKRDFYRMGHLIYKSNYQMKEHQN